MAGAMTSKANQHCRGGAKGAFTARSHASPLQLIETSNSARSGKSREEMFEPQPAFAMRCSQGYVSLDADIIYPFGAGEQPPELGVVRDDRSSSRARPTLSQEASSRGSTSRVGTSPASPARKPRWAASGLSSFRRSRSGSSGPQSCSIQTGCIARASVVAVLRFTTISNLVGNCTGRSPGFSTRP